MASAFLAACSAWPQPHQPSLWGNGPWETGLDERRADFSNSFYQVYPEMSLAVWKSSNEEVLADPCSAGNDRRCLRLTGRWLRGSPPQYIYIRYFMDEQRFKYSFNNSNDAFGWENVVMPSTLPGQ